MRNLSRPCTSILAAGAAALLVALGLAGCGGSGVVDNSNNTPPTPSMAQTVSTVGDRPMSNALEAQVTISAVSAIPASGQPVSLLAAPHTIELTSLGGVREPLSLGQVPEGTYTGVGVTVTAASIVYLDSNGNPVQATATLPAGGATATYTFPSPLAAEDNSGVDLRLDFNLAQSFDLGAGGAVAFTPTITAAMASIDKGAPDDLYVRAAGPVTAISATSVTLTTFDAGLSVTFAIDGSTFFDDNASAASIQVGGIVFVTGTIQSGGSYQAAEIEPVQDGAAFNGAQFNAGGVGRVYRVTAANGSLASFQLVTFTNFGLGAIGRAVTVDVNPSTVYRFNHRALNAGVTAFDATQIFPGQVVSYAGNSGDQGVTVTALGVRLHAQNLFAALLTLPSGTSPAFSFGLQPNPLTLFALLSKATSVAVTTSAETRYGGGLAASGLSGIAVNSGVEVRGFVALQPGGGFAEFATRVAD